MSASPFPELTPAHVSWSQILERGPFVQTPRSRVCRSTLDLTLVEMGRHGDAWKCMMDRRWHGIISCSVLIMILPLFSFPKVSYCVFNITAQEVNRLIFSRLGLCSAISRTGQKEKSL